MTRHVDAERLSAWISGELAERDAGVVRVHVAACAVCAAVESDLRAQVLATRDLDRPEPPPTLWLAIEGALEKQERGPWAWRSSLLGALAGAAAVAAVVWGVAGNRGGTGLDLGRGVAGARAGTASPIDGLDGAPAVAAGATDPAADPLLAEAERELTQAAALYEQAARRLRAILDREQETWDPEARARVAERLAGLDEAVAHSRAVARRAPGDSTGADMLFSAYQRQIDFLAEAVHRGSPGGEGLR